MALLLSRWAHEADAQKAITEFNGKTVEGRPLTVNEARHVRARPPGGGGGGAAAMAVAAAVAVVAAVMAVAAAAATTVAEATAADAGAVRTEHLLGVCFLGARIR